MKALQFVQSIPRYSLTRALGWLLPAIYWSPLACLQLREVPEPSLPSPEWVRIRTRYGGICGSDLHIVLLQSSPATSVFASFPFTLGHENTGTVAAIGAAVTDLRPGDRVVVEPLLGCRARGFTDPCPACQRGETNRCQRFTEGIIAPGIMIGACRDTGGSWAPFFVAHQSQVFRVPDHLSDEEALMVEPFAAALHPVLRFPPRDHETVLVIGAGVIGLCLIAALRAIGSRARVIALAKYGFQADLARALGADAVVRRQGAYDRQLADLLGARLLRPILGPAVLTDGADLVYDCVGSAASLSDALRLARTGGRVVLVGLAGQLPAIDWTWVWLRELTLWGACAYGVEQVEGETVRTFTLALQLLSGGRARLGHLITHKFRLDEYRRALATVVQKGRSGVVKAVFAFD